MMPSRSMPALASMVLAFLCSAVTTITAGHASEEADQIPGIVVAEPHDGWTPVPEGSGLTISDTSESEVETNE